VAQKRNFAVFASKIQILLKEICNKVFCVKTSSGNVVAMSFLYLTVHRWIAGDVPTYLKFAIKVTQLLENDDFDRNRLTVP